MDKPQAASGVRLEKTSILIARTAKGQVVYGGHEIGMSGVQPLVRRELQKEDIPVIIQADSAALTAVKQWKFEPGKRNGKAVRFRMRVPISFPKG